VKTSASTSKQLLTFQSKSGNSFYPVIDRSGKAASAVVLALILAGGAIYYFLKNKKESPRPKARTITTIAITAIPRSRPVSQPDAPPGCAGCTMRRETFRKSCTDPAANGGRKPAKLTPQEEL
jgi:hypothetical protein